VSESDQRHANGQELRHNDPNHPFTPPVGESHLEEITRHVERHFGKVANVFHELISDTVHVDILVVEPTKAHPYMILVTAGMSELPMQVPKDVRAPRFAELVMYLIPSGEMSQEGFADEKVYWPFRHLKQLARMPHSLDTWLMAGQTVSTDPPEPVAPGVPFCALGVLELLDEKARRLAIRDDLEIAFLQVVALHREELDAKMEQGPDRLADLFDTDLLRVVFNDRPNFLGEEHSSAFHRGRRLVVIAAWLMAATFVADVVACHLDDTRLPLGRFALGLTLAWLLVDGKGWVRWFAIVLLSLGIVAGAVLILSRPDMGLNWRLTILAASTVVWAVCVGLLTLPPSVRFFYLGHRERNRARRRS
jgi:hypothetical protein